MNHNQKPCSIGKSVCSTSIFQLTVIGAGKRQRPSIAKYADRLVERYTVFRHIACSLLIVPFELEHTKYLKGSKFEFTDEPPRGGVFSSTLGSAPLFSLWEQPLDMWNSVVEGHGVILVSGLCGRAEQCFESALRCARGVRIKYGDSTEG